MIIKSNTECLTLDEMNDFIGNYTDPVIKCRVQDHMLECDLCFEAVSTLSLPEASDYISRVEAINQDIKLKYNARFRLNRGLYIYTSAAAALLVMLFSYLFFFSSSSEEILFVDYFKPYPNVIPMVRGEGIDFELKAAMVLYNSGNYMDAIAEFDKVLVFEKNEIASFYKSISLIATGEYNSAIPLLQEIQSDTGAKFNDQAAWYEALTYVAMEQRESAVLSLRKIVDQNNYFSSRASSLLNELNKNE